MDSQQRSNVCKIDRGSLPPRSSPLICLPSDVRYMLARWLGAMFTGAGALNVSFCFDRFRSVTGRTHARAQPKLSTSVISAQAFSWEFAGNYLISSLGTTDRTSALFSDCPSQQMHFFWHRSREKAYTATLLLVLFGVSRDSLCVRCVCSPCLSRPQQCPRI